MARIQAVIFDLDGTLVDSIPGIQYAINAAASTILPGRQVSDQQLRRIIGPPIRQMMEDAFDVHGEMLDRLEVSFRRTYDSVGWQRSIAYPGVAETLGALKQGGRECFVVTNKPAAPARRILELLQLDQFLADVVTPDTTQPSFASKAAALAHLITVHGLPLASTLMVGDTAADAQAALANGVAFVPVGYGYGTPEGDCANLMNLTELIPFLQRSEVHHDQSRHFR